MRGSSSRSLGGLGAQQQAGQEDRPYMNLSDVRHGLSSECGKWGNSVASELQKALSSVGEGEVLLAASSMFAPHVPV